MSQHFICAKSGALLQAGYDRQLRDFFFNLFESEDDFPHSPIETSLDGTVDSYNLDSIRARVLLLEPSIPEALWQSIRQDAAANVGNRIVHWTPQGTIEREVNRDAVAVSA